MRNTLNNILEEGAAGKMETAEIVIYSAKRRGKASEAKGFTQAHYICPGE